MELDNAFEEIVKIVGEQNVSNDPEMRYLYHYDFITAEPEGQCDIVVMPESAEEIQQIVKVANKLKIPVIPWVSGINFGSTATPLKGGIVVDLRRLNRILEVNKDDMYALIEGGITWADLQGHLGKYHPDLRAGITWSPPGTGVVASCLCYGMFDLGNLGGTGAEFINGLEVVLGSGELIRVGSCSLSDCWYGRQPLPDLAGLFIGWEGSTGIVTKAAIKLWPKLPFRKDYTAIGRSFSLGYPILSKLSKAGLGICDIVFQNYGWLQSTMEANEKKVPRDAFESNLPDFFSFITTQAYTEKQHDAQCEAIEEIIREGGLKLPKGGANIGSEMPIHLWGCWNFSRGGGGQWIGSYCSSRDVVKYYELSRKVTLKYGHTPQFYGRILFGGHYVVARTNVNFNKDDLKEIQSAREILKEIHDEVQSIDGVVMYKAPQWAHEVYEKKMLPATVELTKKVKKLLDPNGIMNPGHGWGD
ncbi:MAG: FAD-binding oxidoreductase [Candidatus Lokiarchaeota archaeon]|nr:FAD-binding oxidoreductase [Candidatus Lokiarchaeota archaeon]